MVRQPLGDQPSHFKLAVSERRSRARRLAQESEQRVQHPNPVAVVEEVAGTGQREQCGSRD